MKKTLLFLLIISMTNCAIIKEMIPGSEISENVEKISSIIEETIKTQNISTEIIEFDGAQEPHTPPLTKPSNRLSDFLIETEGKINLNMSKVVRIYNNEASSDTVQILVPGIYSGAGSVVNLAKAIVMRSPKTEVWIWERRSNLLEDRRLFKTILERNDYEYAKSLISEKEFKPKTEIFTHQIEDISFAGYWGFNVLAEDLYHIVKHAKNNYSKVVLSGYSLGVLYVTNYLANNFVIKNISEAGYKTVDGVILYDGPSQINGYVKTEKSYKKGIYIFPPGNYIHGVDQLENSKVFPCNTDGTGKVDVFVQMELKALFAVLGPNELSPFPYTNFFGKFPITNEAAGMIGVDDNYNIFKLFAGSLGKADAQHSGVFSRNTAVTITGLKPGTDRISWIHPENTTDEFNNVSSFYSIISNKLYNSSEWYQPTRIILDLGSIHNNDTNSGWQNKYFSVTENSNVEVPTLAIGLTRGLVSHEKYYQKYFDSTKITNSQIHIIDDLLHFDADTLDPTGKSPFADITVRWIENAINHNNY